jgi:arginase
MQKPIPLIAAPTNLGLRPPEPTAVPGTAKAQEALRAAGLWRRLATVADDGGLVPAPRYVDDKVPGSRRLRNHDAVLDYSDRLALRIGELLDRGHAPLVIGGDCSILLGVGQALSARGRFGLIHLDGHTDFRHPGNDNNCASLAGEDLAAAIGLHWPEVSFHGGRQHVLPSDVAHLGCRADDRYLAEVRARLPLVLTSVEIHDVEFAAKQARSIVDRPDLDGYWIHFDVDVLDPSIMPAVDSPDPGGLLPDQLIELLARLTPGAVGAHVTIFDPDLDPDGRYATLLVNLIAASFGQLASGRPRSI